MSNSLSDVSRLYKDLVSALLKSVSEASCGSLDDLEDKEECNEIAEGRAELVLKTVNFELHVQEPFFTQLKDGLKRVEGRCAAGNYNRIQSGALILFNKCLLFEVQDVRQYPSFYAMLKAESLDNVLPGVKTLTDAHRHIGETNMNLYSSRSHTIFRMIIESRDKVEDGEAGNSCDAVRISVLKMDPSSTHVG
ncbi:RNA-binding ASCH domain protein, putative isoform 2 [Cucumis melo var. makuwa]|uniref:RNA-binding ASCH domain protein, putative isoform 2 n=1 Tax=Cucumis melo var. makuwa TaxID=1194695 RepID=A0A5D3E021_CUCMM|nr:RNA-binding ASCH domain protein, putative isoform 2 [Cucumis melo var. makuwa]